MGEGYHHGAGNPHAEVEALKAAGDLARGATVFVTLEPCNHTGRTGPCAQALIEAGVAKVVVAQRDPNPIAEGGLETLAAAGIEIDIGLLADDAAALNRAWTFAHEHGRPFVTWKFATTLDGRSAATDGSSRWVSSPAARRDTHLLRALCDTMLVGTNTVARRRPPSSPCATPTASRSGTAAAARGDGGARPVPESRIFDDAGRDRAAALRATRSRRSEALYRDHGRHHVFFEGGPTLAAAFLKAGVVDEVLVYVAPMLLGGGQSAVGPLGIRTIEQGAAVRPVDTVVLLPDSDDAEGSAINLRLTLRPGSRDARQSELLDHREEEI